MFLRIREIRNWWWHLSWKSPTPVFSTVRNGSSKHTKSLDILARSSSRCHALNRQHSFQWTTSSTSSTHTHPRPFLDIRRESSRTFFSLYNWRFFLREYNFITIDLPSFIVSRTMEWYRFGRTVGVIDFERSAMTSGSHHASFKHGFLYKPR